MHYSLALHKLTKWVTDGVLSGASIIDVFVILTCAVWAVKMSFY